MQSITELLDALDRGKNFFEGFYSNYSFSCGGLGSDLGLFGGRGRLGTPGSTGLTSITRAKNPRLLWSIRSN